jgi:2-amino-4-hydroxy-6-hydroxymethyldihydropteridine diphosphokinase
VARVYLSLGSNIEPERHIRAGIEDLRAQFGPLRISTVFESEPVGFSGNNFYNLVVGLDTAATVASVAQALRAIEDRHGRVRSGPRFSSRTLDIDLLLYDDVIVNEGGLVLPRTEITQNAFVLCPLAEIAPEGIHPVLRRSFRALWEEFDKTRQRLWPVPLDGVCTAGSPTN